MIVSRGFPAPTSFHDQRLLDAPVGYFFGAMTDGFGRMFPYASRIPAEDRWAIAGYVKALQLSQNATRTTCRPTSGSAHPDRRTAPLMATAPATIATARPGRDRRRDRRPRPRPRPRHLARRPTLPGALLMGFVFWIGLSLGGLALLTVNHMAGGSWGAVVRRPLEAMVSALPVALLFFLPVLIFVPQLYPWADAAYVAAHPLVAWKAGYLNTPWFLVRTLLSTPPSGWSPPGSSCAAPASRTPSTVGRAGILGYRLKRISAPWLIVYVLTMTLAITDWTMSLTPEWWSGIYGLIFMISQAICAMALVILTMVWMARPSERVDVLLTDKRLQDLGNFLMAFTMFWAYVNMSQLIIQWTNNIVETNTFYGCGCSSSRGRGWASTCWWRASSSPS
jgi:hypothetical protein